MKKYIFTIVSTFLFSFCFGQEIKSVFQTEKLKRDSLIQILKQERSFHPMKQYVDSSYKMNDIYKLMSSSYKERKLEQDSLYQGRVSFKIESANYQIVYLRENNLILYIGLSKQDSLFFSRVDDSLMANIIKNHQAIYNISLDIKNNEEMPYEYFMYGHACGFGGNIPDKRFKLYSLKYDEIAKWLRSMNPEIQAYGLYGIYKLYTEGYKISIEDVKIMEHLISIKTPLVACVGCNVGVDKTYSDIVTEKQIKKIKRKMKVK